MTMKEKYQIELQAVSKSIGRIKALDNVSLSLTEGEIFGYLGPNGAGKTTTIRLILGLLKPSQGQVRLWGVDPWTASYEVKKKIGVVLDEPGLFENVSLMENLRFYARLYQIDKPHREKAIEKLLEDNGLIKRKNDKVGTFSKGMKKKAALARALLVQPAILILDEPTSGLDPESAVEMRTIISAIALEHKVTVFMSSHNLNEVEKLCRRIAILHKGKIIEIGETNQLRKKYSIGKIKVTLAEPGDIAHLKLLAAKLNPDITITTDDGAGMLTITSEKEINAPALIKTLTDSGIKISEFTAAKASLEDVYLKCVKEAEGGS